MVRKVPVQTPEERKERKRLRSARWYASLDKERLAKHRSDSLKWKRTNPEKCLLTSARMRAKELGLPFNLELKDIVIPEVCPVLGIPLISNTDGSRVPSHNSPSLDKMIPGKGYVKGNVAVISYLANTIKNCATADQILRVGNWVKQRTTV